MWDIDRDYSDDILNVIHPKLGILSIANVSTTIVLAKDVTKHKNHLLQLVHLSDLFVLRNKITKLSTIEENSEEFI